MTALFPFLQTYDPRKDYSRKIGSSISKGKPEEIEAFVNVRSLILASLGVNARNVKDFRIQFRAQTATYTDPRTGEHKEINLPAIQDKKIQEALNKCYEISGAAQWHQKVLISANSKGDKNGPLSLQRNTKALANLPNELYKDQKIAEIFLQQSTKEERQVLSRRFLFTQFFLEKWLEKIQDKIKHRSEALKDQTLSDAQANTLRKEKEALIRLHKELQGMDFYALSEVLASFPTKYINKDTFGQIAEEVQNKVLENIKPRAWKGLRKGNYSEADIEYVKDVAGMLYTQRGEYFNYCEKQNIRRKREGACDIFLKEAVLFSAMRGEYSGDGFKESVLLDGMNQELKKEIQDDLHGIGILASHAIQEIDPKEFDMPPLQGNATEKESKEYVKQQLPRMVEAAKKHKEAIKKDLKLADIPPPPEKNGPGLRDALTTAGSTIALGSALVTVGMYSGVLASSVGPQCIQYIQKYPGRLIASISILDTLRHRVVAYVAPHTRNPENGRIQRKIHYRRIALVSGSMLMAALMGTLLYQASSEGSYLERAGGHVGTAFLGIAQVVDYVWNHSFIQLPISPIRIPGTSLTWMGSIPVTLALQMAGFLNRIPIVQEVTFPIQRAMQMVAMTTGLVSFAKSGYIKAVEVATTKASKGLEYATQMQQKVKNLFHRMGEYASAAWRLYGFGGATALL